jgi:hypothetical protein
MGTFNAISRWNKAWILATIASLMLFEVYWIRSVYTNIYGKLLENLPDITAKYPNFYIDHVAGASAATFRFAGAIILFFAAYLAWGPKKLPFTSVKKYLAIAILFESIYWLAELPYNIQNVVNGRSPMLLFVGFVIQILVAGPLLIVLSVKTWRYKGGAKDNLVKWGCLAGVGYIFGMWANNMFKWFGMSGQRGLLDLFSGITTLGFLNTAITLTLSLALAISGSYLLFMKDKRKFARQLLGIAILLFGLYFALYIAYSWFAPNAWKFVMLTEIWPFPLLGLGIGLLKNKSADASAA